MPTIWTKSLFSAEKLMFLIHWPVMTFKHLAIPACFLSRQQTTSSQQDSLQCWGDFTNAWAPYHPGSRDFGHSLEGPGDLQRVSHWWLPGLPQEKQAAVQCNILSILHKPEGKKPYILKIHSFSCLVHMLKYLQNWEIIHLVLSFNSITDAE